MLSPLSPLLLLLSVTLTSSYTPRTPPPLSTRSAFLKTLSSVSIGAAALQSQVLPVKADDGFTTTESGLSYKTTVEGKGVPPPAGTPVKAQYTGWLDGFESDKKFDSSRDRGRAFGFTVGRGQVIRGWDEAFGTMKVGERRLLKIPPSLGYGDRGAGGLIPGGATLYFDVELVSY